MQITLNQDEILDALKAYVRTQINISEDQDILIDMKAGRGENGYTATLDIVPKTKVAVTSRPMGKMTLEEEPMVTTPVVKAASPLASQPTPKPFTPNPNKLSALKSKLESVKAPVETPAEEDEQPLTAEETEELVDVVADVMAEQMAEGQEEQEEAPPVAPKSIFSKARVQG